MFPPDLEILPCSKLPKNIFIVNGKKDQYLSIDTINDTADCLANSDITKIWFEGGHHLDIETIEILAKKLQHY